MQAILASAFARSFGWASLPRLALVSLGFITQSNCFEAAGGGIGQQRRNGPPKTRAATGATNIILTCTHNGHACGDRVPAPGRNDYAAWWVMRAIGRRAGAGAGVASSRNAASGRNADAGGRHAATTTVPGHQA